MLKRIPWKPILIVLAIAVVGAATYILWPERLDPASIGDTSADYDVEILRDTWGVPHVFGQTDADVAYGLAYAHAEDDFLTIQQTIVAARGRLASVYGKDAAANDYMVHLLRIADVVEAGYERDLSPEMRAICEAYADGLNHYARLHPDEVLAPDVFPLSGRDIVAGSVHKLPLFFDLDQALGEMFSEERQNTVSERLAFDWLGVGSWVGSNTLAVSPVRSANGETFLDVNSHQPWEGPVAWYEVHLHSEEGWDAVGGLFPGTPAIIHGHNRHLGWAFTVNNPDLIDIYVLDINPDDPDQYRFDGEWRDLEVREAPIEVNLFGRLSITAKEEVLWSVYGPVVRQPHGTYAIRYVGFGEVRLFEQLYRLNRARNFEEWQDAMRMQALPMFNVGYADAEGTIYYLYNGLLPIRSQHYDWSQYLPGDTSETLWTELLPFDELPQVLNPESGFIQNCNTTPYETTLDPDNPDPADYAVTFGIEDGMNNRAWRALELLGGDESITEEEFTTYKYDMTYTPQSDMARYASQILDAPLPDGSDAQAALEVVREWDLRVNPENRGAAVVIWAAHVAGFPDPDETTPADWVEPFTQAVETLRATHGRVDVAWHEVNRLRRGDVDLGMGGGPATLHAVSSVMHEDEGVLVGRQGDSYVLLVTWDADGQVHSRSIHQYGSATLDETSPHYADQAELFVERELKPVWLDEVEIRAHLERAYRPGEEIGH